MLSASWVRMPLLAAIISLPFNNIRKLLPTRCIPGCGFSARISLSKAAICPPSASKLIAASTSAQRANRQASASARQLNPVMHGVPLTRHRPSLAPNCGGTMPSSAKAWAAETSWPR
ncbi:hypothetical protein D3C75_865210 [compost metagenome]